jgi:hypothetical protein
MESDQAKIVRKRLKEEKLDAETVLVALVRTLTRRHVDCQFEMRGKPMPTRGGRPRVNSLVATQDALHEFSLRNKADDPEMASMQNMLLGLLTDCQFAAEHNAGIGDDDDEPKMRLVRD